RYGIGASEVSSLPAAGPCIAIEQRWIGDHVIDRPNAAGEKRVDERLEHRVAIERPPPAQRGIGASANDDVPPVEPKLRRELMTGAITVDRSRRNKELSIRGRNHERVSVPVIEHAAGVVLDVNSPDRAAQLRRRRRAVDRRRKRCASGERDAKRKKNLPAMA